MMAALILIVLAAAALTIYLVVKAERALKRGKR
jgi:hypothetical protein